MPRARLGQSIRRCIRTLLQKFAGESFMRLQHRSRIGFYVVGRPLAVGRHGAKLFEGNTASKLKPTSERKKSCHVFL